jgi:hypothetical protein
MCLKSITHLVYICIKFYLRMTSSYMALQPISGLSLLFMRFRNLTLIDGWLDSLNEWSARRKAATHTGQHKQNKRRRTSMPLAGFEPTIPVFKRAKTARPLWPATWEWLWRIISSGTYLHVVLWNSAFLPASFWFLAWLTWRWICYSETSADFHRTTQHYIP